MPTTVVRGATPLVALRKLGLRASVTTARPHTSVELLRALLHEPGLLLMDEATVGLDPASRAQLLEEVERSAHQRGVGVLWATHLVDEARRADRVVVLHRGRVRHDGPAAALCEAQGAADLEQAFLSLTQGG